MADYSGVHMSHSPYLRAWGECHPGGYCAADDWGQGIHEGTYDVVNAWLDAHEKRQAELFGPNSIVKSGRKVHRVEVCGAQNPDYPGEYFCTFPKGHGPLPDTVCDPKDGEVDGPVWDHAAPASGASWNMPEPPKKEKPVTILDKETLRIITALLETLDGLSTDDWPDVYLTIDLKTKSGDKIGAFTDEYGAWVFETASDGE